MLNEQTRNDLPAGAMVATTGEWSEVVTSGTTCDSRTTIFLAALESTAM